MQTTLPTGCEIRVFSLQVGTHTKRTTGLNYDFSIGVVTEQFLGCHWENTEFFRARSAPFEKTEYGNLTVFYFILFFLDFFFFGGGEVVIEK